MGNATCLDTTEGLQGTTYNVHRPLRWSDLVDWQEGGDRPHMLTTKLFWKKDSKGTYVEDEEGHVMYRAKKSWSLKYSKTTIMDGDGKKIGVIKSQRGLGSRNVEFYVYDDYLWVAKLDPQKRRYWQNIFTRGTQWTHPESSDRMHLWATITQQKPKCGAPFRQMQVLGETVCKIDEEKDQFGRVMYKLLDPSERRVMNLAFEGGKTVEVASGGDTLLAFFAGTALEGNSTRKRFSVMEGTRRRLSVMGETRSRISVMEGTPKSLSAGHLDLEASSSGSTSTRS